MNSRVGDSHLQFTRIHVQVRLHSNVDDEDDGDEEVGAVVHCVVPDTRLELAPKCKLSRCCVTLGRYWRFREWKKILQISFYTLSLLSSLPFRFQSYLNERKNNPGKQLTAPVDHTPQIVQHVRPENVLRRPANLKDPLIKLFNFLAGDDFINRIVDNAADFIYVSFVCVVVENFLILGNDVFNRLVDDAAHLVYGSFGGYVENCLVAGNYVFNRLVDNASDLVYLFFVRVAV